jgi:hypothetical protein
MTKRWSWVLSLALAGAVAPTTASLAHAKEHDETKTSMDKVPAAARDELIRKAGGAPIFEVVEEKEDGQVVYEAHVHKGNEVIGYKVDAKGTYLGSEVEKAGGDHK